MPHFLRPNAPARVAIARARALRSSPTAEPLAPRSPTTSLPAVLAQGPPPPLGAPPRPSPTRGKLNRRTSFSLSLVLSSPLSSRRWRLSMALCRRVSVLRPSATAPRSPLPSVAPFPLIGSPTGRPRPSVWPHTCPRSLTSGPGPSRVPLLARHAPDYPPEPLVVGPAHHRRAMPLGPTYQLSAPRAPASSPASSNLGCGSEIQWPREIDSPSLTFLLNSPSVSRDLNPLSLGSCREALRLLFNQENVFKIGFLNSKTSKFITLSYEIQIR